MAGETARPHGTKHATAGDTSSGRHIVAALIWTGATAAGDDLAVKNGAGMVLAEYKVGVDFKLVLYYPFGFEMVDGLESDVLDAGTVEYVWA